MPNSNDPVPARTMAVAPAVAFGAAGFAQSSTIEFVQIPAGEFIIVPHGLFPPKSRPICQMGRMNHARVEPTRRITCVYALVRDGQVRDYRAGDTCEFPDSAPLSEIAWFGEGRGARHEVDKNVRTRGGFMTCAETSASESPTGSAAIGPTITIRRAGHPSILRDRRQEPTI